MAIVAFMRTNKTYPQWGSAKGGPFEAMELVMGGITMDNWLGKEPLIGIYSYTKTHTNILSNTLLQICYL